ncbi:hypothetical protein Tco_0640361 [Tanacetum coccineum]
MDCNKAVHADLQAYRDQVQTHETHIQTRDARIGSLETLVATLKMLPKRTVTTTTPMIDAQIKALISQGVADALAKIEANRTSINGDDSHDSRTGSRRTE